MDLGTIVPEYRYGFIAVDIFTNMTSVIPIENKQPDEIIRALKKVIDDFGKPKQIYSDEEGVFNSNKYIKLINEQNIQHTQTTTHAHTAERFIQSCLNNLYRIINALEQDKSDWVKHIDNSITKYNNTVHNTLKIKPVDAAKTGNHLWVSWHLWNSAKRDRKYPKISQNEHVRIKINQKKTTKGHDPTFSKETHKVVAIKYG